MKTVRALPSISVSLPFDATRIEFLKERNLPLSIAWDDGLALVNAYVTSAQAAAILVPLGAAAIGSFWPTANNMVVIEAIVPDPIAWDMMVALNGVLNAQQGAAVVH